MIPQLCTLRMKWRRSDREPRTSLRPKQSSAITSSQRPLILEAKSRLCTSSFVIDHQRLIERRKRDILQSLKWQRELNTIQTLANQPSLSLLSSEKPSVKPRDSRPQITVFLTQLLVS